MVYSSAIIGTLWFVFILYWIISAMSAKRTLRSGHWLRGVFIRFVILVVVVWILQSTSSGAFISNKGPGSPAADIVGIIFVACGIAFAIWARVHLGRNWGMPMSLKENPELVTSGPYRFVRHPIYTGVMLAMLGSAIAMGGIWLVVFIVSGVYFTYSATQEDKIMAKEFPNQYPGYKRRTKLLIPFVL